MKIISMNKILKMIIKIITKTNQTNKKIVTKIILQLHTRIIQIALNINNKQWKFLKNN